ncbi:MAG TPA: ThiF family adenylyltransferase [Candidatus Bathyarchaeia archaeon]|nr:ThiF family adenylyltransferase [Candidatus Bathyarchaeia archaeon]
MPTPELEQLLTDEKVRPNERPTQVCCFDLSDPLSVELLLSHLYETEVVIEGAPSKMLFWAERDKEGKVSSPRQIHVLDTVDSQLERLFLIQHPSLISRYKRREPEVLAQLAAFRTETLGDQPANFGVAFYYPKERVLLRSVGPELDKILRTASNRGLISPEEQERLRQFNVCFLGLSVGSSSLYRWQQEADPIRIIGGDPDGLEQSNLNRILAGRWDIGENKAVLAKEQVFGHNPYVEAELSSQGLALAKNAQGVDMVQEYLLQKALNTVESIDYLPEEAITAVLDEIAEIVSRQENFGQMFGDIDAIVEEMDDLRMKILARLSARRLGIPLLMASDMGDTVLLDIERYDLNRERPIFNAPVAPKTVLKAIAFPSPESFASVATAITGKKEMPANFAQALGRIGTELIAPPQLASTIACASGIVTIRLREIALGEEQIPSRRELYNFKNFEFRLIPL